MSSPLVSTIMPAYNAASTLDEAIESLRAQEMQDWELIVVDDCSSDQTPAVLGRWAVNDRRIRVQRHEKNSRTATARNTGLDLARGKFVHFLDADDVLLPGAFASMVGHAETQRCDALSGGYVLANGRGEALTEVRYDGPPVGLDDMLERAFMWTGALLFRREVFASARFDVQAKHYEDAQMWLALAERGLSWQQLPSNVAQYRVHAGSLSKRADILWWAQKTFSDVFERSRAGTTPVILKDTSESRWERVMQRIAVSYASRHALVGGVSCAKEAIEIYAQARGPKQVDASLAGALGYYSVLWSLGTKPALGRIDGLRELRAFWEQLSARGWVVRGFLEDASHHFLSLCFEHAEIASNIVGRCIHQRARGIDIIGYGRNGKLLASTALHAGLRVRVRDDRFVNLVDEQAKVDPRVVVADMRAGALPGYVQVISPTVDGVSLKSRFPTALRWRFVVDETGKTLLESARAA
jgi:teichuronic acid biosynthesis glycosyltransferase TuaG